MKLSIGVGGYGRSGVAEVVEFVQAADRLGVDSVWSAEAWGHDAVTSLAYLAGKTERIKIATGIMQISARVPAMTAMTALSLHAISQGRFILGLGVSGPQVVEGLHGSAYDKPLTRLKEHVDICRMAFAGEKLRYDGKTQVLPRPGGEGKAIRLDHRPADIPIFLATLSPKALEYTGEAADGWLGTSFSPEHSGAHLAHVARGAAKAGRTLADIELHAAVTVGIDDDVQALVDGRKPGVAFAMGAMGSAQTNFYNAAFARAGYADDAKAIQDLWIQGKHDEAVARVPDAMVTEFQALGTRDMVRDRLQKYREVGISTLNLRLDTVRGQSARIKLLEEIVDLVSDMESD